jgi:bifunctional enzyme CysN/CysC
VASIDTFEGSVPSASAPVSVTLTLTDEVDVSRGDMLVRPTDVPRVDTRFDASLVWMHQRPLDLEKSYLLKQTTQLVRVEIERVNGRTNLDTLDTEASSTLELNDIGSVRLRCHRPLYFDAYRDNRRTGAFILIDSLSNGTLAAGMIQAAAPPDSSLARDGLEPHSQVSPRERVERLGQRGGVVLLTGLPGAGKSELAYAVERVLFDRGRVALVVDPADAISRDNPEVERHPERPPTAALELCRRGVELGWVVLLPFAAPGAEERAACRARVEDGALVEVSVATPLSLCRERHRGDFYEHQPSPAHAPPGEPDVVVDFSAESAETAAERVVAVLEARGLFDSPAA